MSEKFNQKRVDELYKVAGSVEKTIEEMKAQLSHWEEHWTRLMREYMN